MRVGNTLPIPALSGLDPIVRNLLSDYCALKRGGGCGSRETDMAGKFEIKKRKDGQFYFNLKAGNGEVIATSEAYRQKASALKGIESVRRNAPDAKVSDVSGEA